MNSITKDDFLRMIKLQHLEVFTQDQLSQNTQIIKSYIEKSLTSELSDIEKSDANMMVEEVGSLQRWEVLSDDFSKAICYTRPEQVIWEDVEKGEFGEIIKAKGGVYKLTAENKKLGRVGQKYGESKEVDESEKAAQELEDKHKREIEDHFKKVNESLSKLDKIPFNERTQEHYNTHNKEQSDLADSYNKMVDRHLKEKKEHREKFSNKKEENFTEHISKDSKTAEIQLRELGARARKAYENSTGTIKKPERGTPEWHKLEIAKKTLKMNPAMIGVMGGPSLEEAKKTLDKYGIKY